MFSFVFAIHSFALTQMFNENELFKEIWGRLLNETYSFNMCFHLKPPYIRQEIDCFCHSKLTYDPRIRKMIFNIRGSHKTRVGSTKQETERNREK